MSEFSNELAKASLNVRGMLDDAYREMQRARVAWENSKNNQTRAKILHLNARNQILALTDPKTLGSNEAMRDAALDAKTTGTLSALNIADGILSGATLDLDLARLGVEHARAHLRLLEVAASQSVSGPDRVSLVLP